MRLALIAMILVVAGVASCQSAPKAEVKKFSSDADVPRITVEDAKKDFDAGNVVIIDARAPETYKQEHIATSINIPIGSDAAEFDKIPKGKKIIVYCS